ncbi:formylglycine-generating enzyme family protein [Leptospira semungkisensis]|uniref:Formylglycine-generating enzyme family protein n=1 Tax=Leptospira semungkisensis TaxID=2484985 RepID=A0A4V3JCP9_9LEPT|nr:SUMF1/EgtB/PvdO family nonheme iron enzyme [Leptospira semungkisensis]TGK06939.1 formylglycine-generating enzyme family protein [Leptospira semungkisensis]
MSRAKFLTAIALLLIVFYSEERTGQEKEEGSSDSRKTILWTGEVLSVYRNKGKAKIKIDRNSYFSERREEEIKGILTEKNTLPLFRKPKMEEIGSFQIENIEVEFGKIGKLTKPISIELRGSFSLAEGRPARLVNVGLLIGAYGQETFYQDPASFDSADVTRNRLVKAILHPKDGKEMVLVHSGYEIDGKILYEHMGYFLYGQGTESSEDSYNPKFGAPDRSNLEELPSFYIDKYEVTNKEYNKFLKETGNPPPPHWENGIFPRGKEYHPVTNLTYREVETYANWSGKKVPTEFQWEKAARGTGLVWRLLKNESYEFVSQPRDYPYGNDFDTELCNTRESGRKGTLSVYELPTKSQSPYGAVGMCGNVAEWTSSSYLPYPGHRPISGRYGKHLRVIRGGSYSGNKEEAKTFHRDFGGIPNLLNDRKAGFRLITEVKN